MRARLFGGLVALGVSSGITGCGTIMQGSTQEVSVASSPTAASLTVDGVATGKTPVVVSLKRKDRHVLRLELEGYQPFEMALSRSTSGWVWGNIVFGGLPGLAVDAITGGMYKLTPDQVNATMLATTVSVGGDKDQLVVAVVLRPDPSWERIGSLELQ